MPAHRKIWPKAIKDDLANLTTEEFLIKHGAPWQGNTVRNTRQDLHIHMTAEAKQRAYAIRDQQNASDSRSVSVSFDRRQMIAALEADGFRVSKALPHEPIVRLAGKPGQHFKAAVVCCTHLGNVAQQITHLHDFYQYAEKKGYEDFWNAGDTTDGPDSMHRDAVHEHFVHTFDSAVDYWVQAYPKPKNGKTRLILGNHDESWLKDPSGSDIGRRIAERRPDVEYIGRRAADISVGPLRVYIIHGSGASSYARSYKLQKIVEGFPVPRRPHVLLAGNWHVPAHIPGYMGTEAFMLPSFEHSTPFITSLGKGDSVIGGLLLDIELGQTGIRDIKIEWRLYDTALRGDFPK